jgi:hypothetical protein
MTPTNNFGVGLAITGHLGMMRVVRPSNDNTLPDRGKLCAWDYKAPLCGDVHDGK